MGLEVTLRSLALKQKDMQWSLALVFCSFNTVSLTLRYCSGWRWNKCQCLTICCDKTVMSLIRVCLLETAEVLKCNYHVLLNLVLEKTLESPLDSKEIQPVHPKGNKSWIFIGKTDVEAETPILCLPDAKNWLIWKDPDAGKGWRREEKETTEDEMYGWHHWLNGYESA